MDIRDGKPRESDLVMELKDRQVWLQETGRPETSFYLTTWKHSGWTVYTGYFHDNKPGIRATAEVLLRAISSEEELVILAKHLLSYTEILWDSDKISKSQVKDTILKVFDKHATDYGPQLWGFLQSFKDGLFEALEIKG